MRYRKLLFRLLAHALYPFFFVGTSNNRLLKSASLFSTN